MAANGESWRVMKTGESWYGENTFNLAGLVAAENDSQPSESQYKQ